jgi:poly [ADP-ribose] polymerase
MFGDGKYFAWQSTKSLNYTDGGYWTGGRHNVSSRFMFIMDVAMGKQHISHNSHFFKKPPAGFHSVYGKAGSGLWNDEMITYDFDDKDNQSAIRYLLEIV